MQTTNIVSFLGDRKPATEEINYPNFNRKKSFQFSKISLTNK